MRIVEVPHYAFRTIRVLAGHGLRIPQENWERTSAWARTLVSRQREIIAELPKCIEELEPRIRRGSHA